MSNDVEVLDPERAPRRSRSRTGDGAADPASVPARRIDLNTLDDVRREMARVYRGMDSGRIDAKDAARAVYVLSAIGKVIEAATIEPRLRALEALAQGGARGR